MKIQAMLSSVVIALTCVVLAGCQPQPKVQNLPSASPTSAAPSSVPETQKVQTDVCGNISMTSIASITGVKVSPPSVTTIDSVTGAKRHVCSYSKVGEPNANVVKVTVVFKSETKSNTFQQLWANQQQTHQKNMKSVPGIGTEAFVGQSGTQPVLYVLAPAAQYWIQMGDTTQSADTQTAMIEKIAKTIAE